MRSLSILAGIALLMSAAQPAVAQSTSLSDRILVTLRAAGPGTRFGLIVATTDGKEIVAIAPDDRFVPASNTKMFTTAAALATLPATDQADETGGATVALTSGGRGKQDVILTGRGDARLSSAADCTTDCLSTLADAVAARTRSIRDVVGDASLFPDERWSPGMSWNNIPTRSGSAIAALMVDDNELPVRVTPGVVGSAPTIDALPYVTVDNRAVTVESGTTELRIERAINTRDVRIDGTIAVGAPVEILRLGIDDPAHYAAWRLRTLLSERGVRVRGEAKARYRSETSALPVTLATLVPPPLVEDLRLINKVSQNVHAELLLRRLGRASGTGSIADGHAVVTAMLDRAGVERWRYDLSDGSGMSSYNRVSPRGVVRFLRWSTTQPWGGTFRDMLPIGGVDGTLALRFVGTPLQGKILAKTGTLNQANALAGFLTAKSGRTLVFAAYANDMPGAGSATKAIDAALLLIAHEN